MSNTTALKASSPTKQPSRTAPNSVLTFIRDYPLLPVLVLAVVAGSFIHPNFLTVPNLLYNVLEANAPIAIVVLAIVPLLIAAKIDISIESTAGLVPLVAAWLVVPAASFGLGSQLNPFVAILIALVVAVAIGAINGYFVVFLKIDAFIFTLAMLILIRGISTGLTNSASLSKLPTAFTYLGTARWLGLPASIWIAGIMFVIGIIIMEHHRTGRAIYAIGGNPAAARAAGIRVNTVLFWLFVVAAVFAAIAGFMVMGRVGAVSASLGQNWIFQVMAAAVIGGVDINGGKGRMFGALLGVLLLGVVNNLLVLGNVPVFWINATNGAFIAVALILSKVFGGKKTR
ncbi:ABC transporter permease [Paenarthrobacter nicotinovorans]|uniref:ABC transporter permease n=1 Tax=Paenarthrobacter nicotinovorans TaxID=29320 RepID=UPI00380E1B7E